MKFGKRLQRQQYEKWRGFYLDYKELKKEIKRLKSDGDGASWEARLMSELAKVNWFYLDKEANFHQRLQLLEARAADGDRGAKGAEPLATSFSALCEQLEAFRYYVVLNYLAVYKIVKKRNRHLPDATPIDFNALLLRQPFYTSHRLGRITVRCEMLAVRLLPPGALVAEQDFLCPICLDVLVEPVVLSCAHRFCWKCISRSARTMQACPVCRKTQSLCPSNFRVDGRLSAFLVEHFPHSQHHRLSHDDDDQRPRQDHACIDHSSVNKSSETADYSPVKTSSWTSSKAVTSTRSRSGSSSAANLVAAAAVSLFPLHWLLLLVVLLVAYWPLALAAAVVLLTYPHFTWQESYEPLRPKKRTVVWNYIVGIGSALIREMFHYFSMTLTRTHELDPKRKYLFGYHPHGMYCFGVLNAIFPEVSGWNRLFPGISCSIGVANATLCIPILCSILRWIGFVPASKRALESAVAKGQNLVLVPGGIAEMFEGGENDEVLFLNKRTGFVRFAIVNGLDLVPVYGFGENRTFRRYTFAKAARQLAARKFKLALQLYSGRWGTLVPFNVKLDVVVGEPVRVTARPDPTEADVAAVLDTYKLHLERLFEQHKGRYGYAGKRLVIV